MKGKKIWFPLSLSVMVITAELGEPSVAPVGLLRVAVNVSLFSCHGSSRIVSVMFLLICPGLKVSVPEAVARKSLPMVALLPTIV